MRLLLRLVLGAFLVAQAGQMRVVHCAGLGLALDAPSARAEGLRGGFGCDLVAATPSESRSRGIQCRCF